MQQVTSTRGSVSFRVFDTCISFGVSLRRSKLTEHLFEIKQRGVRLRRESHIQARTKSTRLIRSSFTGLATSGSAWRSYRNVNPYRTRVLLNRTEPKATRLHIALEPNLGSPTLSEDMYCIFRPSQSVGVGGHAEHNKYFISSMRMISCLASPSLWFSCTPAFFARQDINNGLSSENRCRLARR